MSHSIKYPVSPFGSTVKTSKVEISFSSRKRESRKGSFSSIDFAYEVIRVVVPDVWRRFEWRHTLEQVDCCYERTGWISPKFLRVRRFLGRDTRLDKSKVPVLRDLILTLNRKRRMEVLNTASDPICSPREQFCKNAQTRRRSEWHHTSCKVYENYALFRIWRRSRFSTRIHNHPRWCQIRSMCCRRLPMAVILFPRNRSKQSI